MLDRIARARARARAHVWDLIERHPAGFPWLVIAGKTLTGWLVIDMDATLVTASSDKEGAAPTWKKGYGFHPLGAWCRQYPRVPGHAAAPGNAGSNTFTDHKEVLAAAIRQVPARFRRKILVRVDGAGASHDLIRHLLSLSSPRRIVLFTCGWTITAADEDAIRQVPAGAWKPGTAQDGTIEDDKDVAEITGLMTRAGNWPDGLRWIARRVKPSRRHLRNLTDYEKKTGWKYSITCTNIPDTGISGVPGSHHPQYIDVVHREHAVVETAASAPPRPWACATCPRRPGRSTAAGSSPRTSPPTSTAWTRLLGSATTRNCGTPTRTRSATGSGTSPPASPATPASASWRSARTGHGRTRSSPAGNGYAPCRHPPDQHERIPTSEGGPARRGRSRCAPGHTGHHRAPPSQRTNRHQSPKNGHQHNQ